MSKAKTLDIYQNRFERFEDGSARITLTSPWQAGRARRRDQGGEASPEGSSEGPRQVEQDEENQVTRPEGYPDTPQHDKLDPHRDAIQSIGGFIDWLDNESPYLICEYADDDAAPFSNFPRPVHRSIESWLCEYFGVDLDAYRAEKEAVLKFVQASVGGEGR